MKRFFSIMAALMVGCAIWAQDVLTVVYATSDDGFVNVRKNPSMKAPVLTKLYVFSHGLGQGVLRGKSGNWGKVSVGKTTGWAYSKYVGEQTWYEGNGQPKLVATKASTPIYTDNYKDAVLKAVNLGEDTDTTAAICGGLAGIYYGYDEIPIDWIETVDHIDKVLSLCEKYEELCDEYP